MIRKFTLLALGLVLAFSLKAQDWRDELMAQNAGVIDSVVQMQDPLYALPDFESYMIYYKQPLQHDAPEAGYVPLRALLILNCYKKNVTDQVIQMSIGGYALDPEIVKAPNYWADIQSLCVSTGELAGRFNGHILMPEHRFYGESRPDNHSTLLSHCNAKEAAADFHALAEMMKKVFNGKWVISGVSKGGITAAIQQAYYPEDADCFVTYVGPVNDGVNDLRHQEYWLTKTWTPELREHALHIQKEILNRPNLFEYFKSVLIFITLEEYKKRDQCSFLNSVVCKLDENAHQYTDRSEIEKIFRKNQEVLQGRGLSDYNDAMLFSMLYNNSYDIDGYEMWEEDTDKESETQSTRVSEIPSFLTDEQIYAYQSLTELGYFNLKWDYYYDTQAQADSVNALWREVWPNIPVLNTFEVFSRFEYDPSLMNLIKQKTAEAKKPMLFIYGEDDPWTGACIDDEYINGTNVRKYILPAQCHTACIHDIKDSYKELKDEIISFLESALRSSPTGISEVNDEAAALAGIVFDQQNRHIVISRNGKQYDILGRKY